MMSVDVSNFHSEAKEWLQMFQGEIACGERGVSLTGMFVQMGVEEPTRKRHCEFCDRPNLRKRRFGSKPPYEHECVLCWMVVHQREWNVAVYTALEPEVRQNLRATVRRDVKHAFSKTDLRKMRKTYEPAVALMMRRDFGRIVQRSYGKELLESFLVAKPSWCNHPRPFESM